jgi:hypothetical protein
MNQHFHVMEYEYVFGKKTQNGNEKLHKSKNDKHIAVGTFNFIIC